MELFRFRVIRPVLSQPCAGFDVTRLLSPPAKAGAGPEGKGAHVRESVGSAVTALERQLTRFSSQLAQRSDKVTPKECRSMLSAAYLSQVRSKEWKSLGHQLAMNLIDAMTANDADSDIEAMCRMLLVYDAVTTLASDAAKPQRKRSLKTTADIQAMVSWRHVVLPADLFPNKSQTALLARRPGFTDLYVVRDEWSHYEPGELASVVNVLPGEMFENRIRHAQQVDTLTSTTTQTATTESTEHEQTMSTSLAEYSSKDASLNIGIQGQVQTSGQYGPTQVTTSLGAQLQISQTQSDSKASTTAYQTVERAARSVSQTVTSVQSQRTLTRDSTYSDHKLQNSGEEATVGMYRWLNEVHYVELVRYPNRFVLEFEVPEPGAWLRWALSNVSTSGWDNPDPGPFRLPGASADLSPSDITADNYTQLAQQWRIRGLTPPPPDSVTESVKLSVDASSSQGDSNSGVFVVTDNSMSVPPGYVADKWSAWVASWGKGINANESSIYVTVGGYANADGTLSSQRQFPEQAMADGSQVSFYSYANGVVGAINSGVVPVAAYAHDNLEGLTLIVNVDFTIADETKRAWQQSIFDQVAAGYQTLLEAYHQERDTRDQHVSGQVSVIGSPELNQSRIVNELRRAVIQDLLGQQLKGENDITTVSGDGDSEPYLPAAPLCDTDLIQFFEQAFEWENLVYICYPYYWARHTQWVTDVTSSSADPVLDQFLNAGSARVVVPARPGFENSVMFYLYTGLVWSGSQPPAPDDPSYLSIAQEIEALQRGATDGTPIAPSWQVKLPTTLLWAGTDPATLPANDGMTIPKPLAGEVAV